MESPAHIFILGGTGRVGQLFTAEAIKRNHKVTALIRTEGSLKATENLTLITGSPTSTTDILNALNSINSSNITIVSTLGQTRTSGNPWSATTSPPKFMSESTQAIIDAITSLQTTKSAPKTRKLIQLSMFGAKQSFQNLSLPFRLIMSYSNMAQTVEDHNLVSDLIEDNFTVDKLNIPYVMVRPAMLKFGAAEVDGVVRVHAEDGVGAGFMPSLQARDVSRVMVDALEGREWDGRAVVISN